jgi:uncharacterized delta-60 repeat protein
VSRSEHRDHQGRRSLGSFALLSLVLTLIATLAPVAQAAKPGALDRTFGGDGKVTTNFKHYNYAADAAIDRHGRIVAVGHPWSYDFGLARYRRNGRLDRAFSGNGKVARGIYGTPTSVAIDAKGRIVVAGEYGCDGDECPYHAAVLARYNPNGSIDRSFGPGGDVGLDLEGYDDSTFASVAIDPQGRIVVAGTASRGTPRHPGDFLLARYTSDGRPDPSFGGDGTITTDFDGGSDGAGAVAIDPQGRIVAAGGASSVHTGGRWQYKFALARYGPNGALDPSFDGDGKVTTQLEGSSSAASVTIDPQGRILAAGSEGVSAREGHFALARYESDGGLDSSFGTGGIVSTTFGFSDAALSVAIDSHERIVAAGESDGPHRASMKNFALARYRRDGRLDRSFSRNGKVKTTFGGDDVAESVVLDSDDRIVAAGGGGRKDDFALARYIGYRHR